MSMSSQARYRQSDPRPTHDDIIHFSEVSWDDYERLLVMRGDHSAPRIAYLEGDVEIMSPSQTHESIKSVIGRLVETDCLERDIVFSTYGSWTLKDKARDPETGHTCTGKPWPFGATAHIGADADSALVHSVELTAANVADVTQTVERLHGEEARVHADAGYTGVPKREEAKDLEADWFIAEQRGKVLAMQAGPLKEPTVQAERLKATIRARVEHPFHGVKNLFRQRMLRYRGLAKTGTPWRVLFALANRVIAKKAALLASCARGAPDIRAHRENGRMSVRFSRQACSLCESGPKNRAPSAPGQKWANRSAVP